MKKKREYLRKLNENEKKYQEKLRKRYNSDTIFDNKSKEQSKIQDIGNSENRNKNDEIVVYKKSIFKKIIKMLKSIF